MTQRTILQRISDMIYNKKNNNFIINIIDTNRSVIREFIKKVAKKTKKGSKVLDAGAGEGRWGELFKHTEYKTQDKEVGEPNWDYSKIDYKSDITKIPVNDKTFDVILCTEVLEHLPEPEKALKELSRIIKKKGRLYLTAPQSWGEHEVPYDYYRYTTYGLRYLLEKTGFKVNKIEKRGGYFKFMAFRMWHIFFIPFMNRKELWKRIMSGIIKIILLPFLLLNSLIFYYLDFLDKEKFMTLGYLVEAEKK